MNEQLTSGLEPEAGFAADSTSSSGLAKAAHDLRVAAGEKAKGLAHAAEEKAAALKERAAASAEQFRSTATEKAQQFRETATEKWNDGRVRAKELHGTAEDYVRQNPTKSVLIALGTGFLVGLLVRR